MKTLVFIRLQQLKFFIRHSPVNHKIRMIVVIILFILSLLLMYTKNPVIYLVFPTALAIIIQHFRKDYFLLKKTGLFIHTTIFFEYLFLSSPFVLAGILFGHTMAIIIFVLFLIILPHVYPILQGNQDQKSQNIR